MTAVMPETQSQTLTVGATRDELADALAFIGALSINKRCMLPVLSGVKITAASGLATVEAFDYETHAVQVITATGEGCALIPHGALAEIVKSCDKGATLTLTTAGDKVTLTDGEATYSIPLLPLDEYPQAPLPGAITLGTFTPDMLAYVAATLPAAGRDSTLPVLTGVCFDPAGTWHTATTDRYRLAVYDTGIVAQPDAQRVLVPVPIVAATIKRLRGDVTVTYTDVEGSDGGRITFTDGTRTVTTRTLYGEFPKWRALMPEDYRATLVVDTKRAVKATKRAAIVCSRTSPVVIHLDSDGATVTAGMEHETSASAPAGGVYTGDAMRVGVNPAYLLDMLSSVGADSLTFGFVAECKPFVAWDAERPELRWLQMPVRLSA